MVTLSTGWVVGCVLVWLLSNAFAVAIGFNICTWIMKLDKRMKRKRHSSGHMAPSQLTLGGYIELTQCADCKTIGDSHEHMFHDNEPCIRCGCTNPNTGLVGYWNGYKWLLKPKPDPLTGVKS